MKRNTITYCAIVFSFIIVAFFLAIITPGRNAKADEILSDFYGDVYFGVHGNPPPSEWDLWTKVKLGSDSSDWHYHTTNHHYNEYAEFGTGTYIIRAEHRIFETQEVKARNYVIVPFSGDPVRQDIVTLPEKEPEK